jgi:membrane protease YdiL (CAAX protease family)
MQYRSVKGFTGLGQLGILLVFLGAGFLLAGIVQLVIGFQLIPPDLPMDKMADEMMKAMTKPENVTYARISQVLGTFCLLFIPTVLYLIICHGRNAFWLGFNKHINARQIILGFFLIFLANITAGPLEDFSKMVLSHFPYLDAKAQRLEDSYSELAMVLSNLKSWGEFFMAIVIMAFFPALFEEIFFRGALQNLLERWWKAPLIAVIVTSLIFSVIHMSLYLFLTRALLGFVLGLMYQRSRNLWVNIIAHFLNNTVALIQVFWISQNKEKIEMDKLDPKVPLWGVLIAIVISYGLFVLFERVSVKNRKQIAFEEQDLLEHSDVLNPFPGKNV